MMLTVPISLIVVLLCSSVSSDDTAPTTDIVTGSDSVLKTCTDASQCPDSTDCAPCPGSETPVCGQAVCLDGRCAFTKQCPEQQSSTTPPTNQCTGTDTSGCIFERICADCIQGHTPFCTQAVCVNDECKIIPACSVYTPTNPPSTSTTALTNQCTGTDASSCIIERICADCIQGYTPFCTQAVCVNDECKIIPACSIYTPTNATSTSTTVPANQCTGTDASGCIFERICADCIQGHTPSCTQAVCVNDECKIIPACSVYTPTNPPSTSTTAPTNQCTGTDASSCIIERICADCIQGYSPFCTQAVCVNDECKIIPACSIYTPTNPPSASTTAPTNQCTGTDASGCIFERICADCIQGYTPFCTQAVCVNDECKIIPACSIYTPTNATSTSTTAPTNQCTGTDTSGCVFERICADCIQGYTPFCTQAVCVNDECKIIPACSVYTPTNPPSTSTITPANQCTGTDASGCIFERICADCIQGHSPFCTQAVCVNDECKIIPACSIYTPTSPPSTSKEFSTTTDECADDTDADDTQCADDSQCPHSDYCAEKCEDGLGPLCTSAKCVDGKCQIISPCSQKSQCTNDDVSQCDFPKLCALCIRGRSPPCARATCKNGQCEIISPCSISSSTDQPRSTVIYDSTTTSSTDLCETDADCCYVEPCVKECKDGYGPLCGRSNCIDGRCVITPPCSQATQCTDNDLSQCNVSRLCVLCRQGYGPACPQVTCKNGQCQVIPHCSIYLLTSRPLSTGIYDPVTTSPAGRCQIDADCRYFEPCVKECKDGYGPLCGRSNCINGRCVITAPCSQKSQCTDNDVSQCVFPKLCALCIKGRSPACARATCENGQCKTIMPCSISTELTTTIPPNGACSSNDHCCQPDNCVTKCPVGTTPLCASAKCVNGKCIDIKPCSQRTCTARATCPYNKRNCVKCAIGYGPGCEQPACSCGICSIIPPCSKKLQITINPIAAENK